MTKYFVFLFLVVSNKLLSQKSTGDNFLRNDGIKYEIAIVSRSILHNRPSMNYIIIDMPKKTKKFFLRQNFEYWKAKLTDTTSDWAANLVLYFIYERDAMNIKHLKNDINLWRSTKENQISFWKEFLRSKE